jgi:hypothetical protein
MMTVTRTYKAALGQADVPAARADYQDHWHTWTVNRGYYGASNSDDRNTTRWTIEWVKPNTRAGALAMVKRAKDIDAIVNAHARADRNNNRRARLAMTTNTDGTVTLSDYDFHRWTATLPATA